MLKVDNITISYKGNPVVKNFSMDMERGRIISLVGESGSGKTSVIRAILGLLPIGGEVSSGDIIFDGESLLSYSEDKWNQARGTKISMIFKNDFML